MVRVLAVADETTVLDRPLVFVPGNHDPDVDEGRAHRSGQFLRAGMPCEPPRPAGCRNVDGTVLDIGGLRIAGLGGCVRYRPRPEPVLRARVRPPRRAPHPPGRPAPAPRPPARRRPAHARTAPRPGDEADRAHALHTVLERLQPQWHLHGHLHPHGHRRPDRPKGVTTIRNVIPHRLLEITPAGAPALAGGRRDP